MPVSDDCPAAERFASVRLINKCSFHFADNIGIETNQRAKIEKIQEFSINYIKNYNEQKIQMQQQQLTGTLARTDFNRIIKLMAKMNILRALEPELIEDLFFTNLIGPVQIDSVIPHILKLGGGSSVS